MFYPVPRCGCAGTIPMSSRTHLNLSAVLLLLVGALLLCPDRCDCGHFLLCSRRCYKTSGTLARGRRRYRYPLGEHT
jgi:hypothetical protein